MIGEARIGDDSLGYTMQPMHLKARTSNSDNFTAPFLKV